MMRYVSVTAHKQAQKIISNHLENRQRERMQDPDRFGMRPTLGELSLRQPPSSLSNSISGERRGDAEDTTQDAISSQSTTARNTTAVAAQEIDVRQHATFA